MAGWDDISAPAGDDWDAVSAPAGGKRKPKRRRSLMDDAVGAVTTFNRNFVPFSDELSDGIQAGVNIFAGRAKSPGEAWRQARGQAGQAEASFAQDRPRVAALTRGTGNAASVALPVGTAANVFAQGGRAVNAVRGATVAATQAAAYGAGDRGTAQERLEAANRAAFNPVTLGGGAIAGRLSTPRAAPRKPKPNTSNAETLRALGVETSIPQRMGGMAKQAEDLAMRAPILGPAVSGARGRQVEQFNRGIGLTALRPVGRGIPKDVKPGFEMVEYVDDALGQVYDDAAKLVPRVQLDDALVDDFAKIGQRRVDLADSEAAQFDRMVADRLNRLRSGEASGAMVKQIHAELGARQAEAARKGNDTLAGMLGDTRRSLLGLIERANPQAREMIRRADEGWQVYSMMNDAAAKASNRGGVFLPGQYNTEVRGAGRRIGSNMTGKGKAPTQDIATAATSLLPDQFGNPGTANAVGLGGLGVGLLTEPATTLTVAGGLSAASTPYWMMGRKILEELPPNASPAQLVQADRALAELASKDPAVAALRRAVAAKLERAAAVSGAERARQPANPFAQP